MAASVKSLVTELSNRGPHRVLRGELAFAGQPGQVYTPEKGFGLPAVAFGHAWISGIDRYRGLFEHLASWGIVVAAPDTQRGPVPSHLNLASDLRTALDICVGVRLGQGNVSVAPDRLAVAGHGMGAGSAVLAAAQHQVTAVATLFPTYTAPRAENYAPSIVAPGLVVADGAEITAANSDATKLAAAWGGTVVLRSVEKSTAAGLVEGRGLMRTLTGTKAEPKTQKTIKALLTGFLLATSASEDRFAAFADPEADIPKTHVLDPHAERAQAPTKKSPIGQISQLLGR